MTIDKVTVCGQQFEIQHEEHRLGRETTIKFSATVDGKQIGTSIRYDTNMMDELSRACGVDAEQEMSDQIALELRMIIYRHLRDVELDEITSGKRLDLLKEFVTEFGPDYIDSYIQDQHIDIIAEAMGDDNVAV